MFHYLREVNTDFTSESKDILLMFHTVILTQIDFIYEKKMTYTVFLKRDRNEYEYMK